MIEAVRILKDRLPVWTVWIKKKGIQNLLNGEAKQYSLNSVFRSPGPKRRFLRAEGLEPEDEAAGAALVSIANPTSYE